MAVKVSVLPGKKMLPDSEDAVTAGFYFCNKKTLPTGMSHPISDKRWSGKKAMKLPDEVAKIGTTVMRAASAVLRSVGIEWMAVSEVRR